MIGLGSSALKIYLAAGPCDTLMGVNGLATSATERLSQAFSLDAVFAFINMRRGVSKCLPTDFSGFLSLCPCRDAQRWLESARPPWRMGT